MALIVFIASSHAQNTIHVPADQPTIQTGIDAANNGDTVLVAPGTYNENIDFKGKAITVTSGATAFSGAASTIISGSAVGPVVVFQSNEPSASVLNGFTVQNGHGSGTFGPNGGGISIAQASPTITNNIVTNNIGCGVLVFNLASPLIQENDIKQNKPDAFNTCATPTSEASPGTGSRSLAPRMCRSLGTQSKRISAVRACRLAESPFKIAPRCCSKTTSFAIIRKGWGWTPNSRQ